MKLIFNKIPWLALVVSLVGCAYHRTIEKTYNEQTKGYDITKFTGIVWFNRSAVNGLEVGKRTKTDSTTLKIKSAATETQEEVISTITRAAVQGAVKGALVP